MKVFAKEKIKLQHSALNYYIDLYFSKYRFAVEIDQKVQLDRGENKEKERKNKIKETLKCRFIRVNPEKEKLDVFLRLARC